ncbi:MAG: hypothetical protein LUC43_06340, partial [Burkholderiales bacterium]|nr:hypothetical protein [Burkholderiales bacterium]
MAVTQKKKKGLLQTGEIRMSDLKYLSQQYLWGSFFDQQKAMQMFDFHPPGESKVFKGLIVSYSQFIKYIEIETDMFGGVVVRSPLLLTNTMLYNLFERVKINAYQLFGKEDVWQFKPTLAASQPIYEMAHVMINGECCYCAIYRKNNLKAGQVLLRTGEETLEISHKIPKIIIAPADASIAEIEASLKKHQMKVKKLEEIPINSKDPKIEHRDNGEEVIRVEIDGKKIDIALERSYARKTITLYCGKKGLRLRAPEAYPISKLLRFVGSKKKWISSALTRIQEKAELSSAWEKRIFEDHEFPWLGT